MIENASFTFKVGKLTATVCPLGDGIKGWGLCKRAQISDTEMSSTIGI